MTRVRIGILLIILSWLPIAQAVIIIAHHTKHLTSSEVASEVRLGIWAVQIVIGLIGVWLVGKAAVAAAKTDGWKHLPASLWRLFRSGVSSGH